MEPCLDTGTDSDVLAARTGDHEAFARLVTRYRGVVSSISLSTVGNVATSEEVAQEVFLSAWRDLGSLRNPSSFLPWLRQLTRHRALDAARGGRRKDQRGRVDEDALETAADPGPNAQDALLQDERTRAVLAALDALPADAREVLTLYYREGQSIEQVASLLELREDTAKKRLSRARAALREEVLAHFADAIETTAPSDAFTGRVMAALPLMSPAVAVGASKAALHALGKWATLAATAAGLLPLLIGGLMAHFTWRSDRLAALDEREGKQLRNIGIVTLLNYLVFSLGAATLGPRVPGSQARMWIGLAQALVFTAVHFVIYFVWRPRVLARRLRAGTVANAVSAARASSARRTLFRVWLAILLIAPILLALCIHS